MEIRPISAGRVRTRPAPGPGGRRTSAILLAAGLTMILGGFAILLMTLAPMFTGRLAPSPAASSAGPGGGPWTVVAPSPSPGASPDPSPSPSDLPTSAPTPVPAAVTPVDGVSFILRIPVIGYSALVRQGVTLDRLQYGPGHYPTTPWPGQSGNVGVAGHNTFWLSFNQLKPGDRVEIQTQHALYVYSITGSKVVAPDDRTVLAPSTDARLTLTTCWPLWSGQFATKRLVFFATQVGAVG